MTKIDLITGFLGAGKTTFIRRYVQYLMARGYRVGIVENDFGAVNVDMMLFQDLVGDQCDIEMIAGGCDEDCHRRRFKTKLIAMGMLGYDRVIVEPSGIYDTDEFFDVLQEDPVDRWFEPGSVITVVDAGMDPELSQESQYLFATQLATAGKVVFSHTGNCGEEQQRQTCGLMNRVMEDSGVSAKWDMSDILRKPWEQWGEDEFAQILNAGYHTRVVKKLWFDQSRNYSSVYIMNQPVPEDRLKDIVRGLFEDPACGTIFRIKGFVSGQEGWLQLNATRDKTSLIPIAQGQEIIVVIGEQLVEEKIRAYWG